MVKYLPKTFKFLPKWQNFAKSGHIGHKPLITWGVRFYLRSPLLVLIRVRDAVDLEAVRLERAPLGEGLLTQVALVGTDA